MRTLTAFALSLFVASLIVSCGEAPRPAAKSAVGTLAKDPGPTDADAPKEFTQTTSGLKYRILRKSAGRKPTSNATVVVHYKGWLTDGTLFDASYGSPTGATSLSLDQVIGGWKEGLLYVGEGGMIELEIPPDLGYGNIGVPPQIPGDATLHFIVELLEVQ